MSTKTKTSATTPASASTPTLAALALEFDEATRRHAAAVIGASAAAEAHEAATRGRNHATTRAMEALSFRTPRAADPGPPPIDRATAIAAEFEAESANREAHRELAAASERRSRLGTLVAQTMHAAGVKYARLGPDRLIVDTSKYHPPATGETTLIDYGKGEARRGLFTRAPEWSAAIEDLRDAADL
jgi:hypothetical protein